MYILGIDTSCDDASVAVSLNDRLLSNVSSSQVAYHSFWGGVVPSIAKRKHRETIDGVIQLALKRARVSLNDIEVIAVTTGPGLAVALEVGVEKAKELASALGKRVVEVNHMEGHLYASFCRNREGNFYSQLDAVLSHKVSLNLEDHTEKQMSTAFPVLAMLLSGGHTEMILMLEHLRYEVIGRTKDDAVGEAYDKVARMLNLGYPGGPVIERLAKQGRHDAYAFPVSMLDGGLDFSYSGLKTAVLRQVQLAGTQGPSLRDRYGDKVTLAASEYDGYLPQLSNKPTYQLTKDQIYDVAASFQYAAVAQLSYKLRKALEKFQEVKTVVLGGGVVGNVYLKQQLRNVCKRHAVNFIFPTTTKLTMDNAGMIAVVGWYKAVRGMYADVKTLDRKPGWELSPNQ